MDLLRDEQHVDRAKIEIVVERECSKTIVCWMETGI